MWKRLKFRRKIITSIKKFISHRAIWITFLSILTFVIPALIDAYVHKNYEFSFEKRQLLDISFSLLIIFLNILIVKKWLSFGEVGLRRRGVIRAFVYSFVFVSLLRILDYLDYKEAFPKEFWEKRFLLYLAPFIFSAFQEELMFRGIIFKVWEKWKGFLVALFISSILFGLEHLVYPALGFSPVTTSRAVITALWGPVFALIVYRTGNIWGLTLSHFLYNASISASEEAKRSAQPKISFEILAIGLFIFLPIILDSIDKWFCKNKKKIIWSRYLATTLVIFFILLAGYGIAEDLGITKAEGYCPIIENEKVKECIENIRPEEDFCRGIDLEIGNPKEKLRGNEKALQILKDECLWLGEVYFHDLTGDGKEELAMITMGAGCANCHWNRIYILKDDEIIFQKDTEDVFFWPAEDYNGFAIMYPLRQVDEPYCCPTEGIMESYQVGDLSSKYKYFYKFDERSQKYKE